MGKSVTATKLGEAWARSPCALSANRAPLITLLMQVASLTKNAFSAALGDQNVVEMISGAFAPGARLPPGLCFREGLGHEDAVVAAFLNGQRLEQIVARLAHEDAEIIAGQDGIVDHVVIEIEVQ